MEVEQENFSSGLRSHGSLHELNIPLFVYNAKNAPPSDYFKHNLDLARWIHRLRKNQILRHSERSEESLLVSFPILKSKRDSSLSSE